MRGERGKPGPDRRDDDGDRHDPAHPEAQHQCSGERCHQAEDRKAQGLVLGMTVRENISFGLRQRRLPSEEIARTTSEFVKMVGLERFAERYPGQLSGGMKQRVAIARVLANNANILLMDEPFGALDALTREQLQRELLQIWARTGVTAIFVTHSVEEAVLLADRVLVMSAGPGRIDSDSRIDLARPRDVSSPEFNALRRDIGRRLTSHLAPSQSETDLQHSRTD